MKRTMTGKRMIYIVMALMLSFLMFCTSRQEVQAASSAETMADVSVKLLRKRVNALHIIDAVEDFPRHIVLDNIRKQLLAMLPHNRAIIADEDKFILVLLKAFQQGKILPSAGGRKLPAPGMEFIHHQTRYI